MAAKNRAQLKSIWITGSTITETNFIDLFDSINLKLDEGDLSNITSLGTVTSGNVDAIVNSNSVGLGNVENTALSTWPGTTNITTLGNITTGTWNGTTIDITKGGTGQVSAQAGINALSQVSGATNEYVLTKDTATGNAIWKLNDLDTITDNGATTVNTINVGKLESPSIQVTGGIGTQGTMSWDAVEESIALILNGTTSHINHDTFYHVRNTTGVTIPRGTAVYANGTVGGSGKITVAPFIADGSIPSRLLMGITTEDILNNTNGKVAHFGRINNHNTSAWNNGDILWCSPTVPGGFTTTEPTAPNLKLAISFVAYSHANNGVMYVRYTEGARIFDAHDVEVINPQDKDRLSWDAATQRWTNSAPQDLAYTTISTDYNLPSTNQRVFVNAASPSIIITVTAPANPVINTVYEIIDADGHAGTDKIVFDGNGKTIRGLATWDMDANWYVLKVVYNGTEWNII